MLLGRPGRGNIPKLSLRGRRRAGLAVRETRPLSSRGARANRYLANQARTASPFLLPPCWFAIPGRLSQCARRDFLLLFGGLGLQLLAGVTRDLLASCHGGSVTPGGFRPATVQLGVEIALNCYR